ncbi:MAG: ribbon-helix-helix protein, CopG family [Deltaproteobacteria bacterium]|nr:ribbon-helix-helix protein, CopG family [Deltaproteobacteria bacterium]
MRTTLTLDDDVAAKLQAEVRRSGRTLKEIANEALRTGLTSRRRTARGGRFVVRARSLGLKEGLSYDSVAELLEALDGSESR